MVAGLHTLICEVSNMDRAVEFYRDTLGFNLEYASPYWSTLRIGTTRVGLHPVFDRTDEVRGGGWIFGLDVTDIAAFRSKLESSGVVCSDYHDTPGGAIFNFSDADGNRLQAMQPGKMIKDLS